MRFDMDLEKSRRLTVIEELLARSRPLDALERELSSYPWDFSGKGVEISVKHLQQVLEAYIMGKMTSDEVEKWANLIELREDIEIPEGTEVKIDSVLHELANPTLTHRLNPTRARELHVFLGDVRLSS